MQTQDLDQETAALFAAADSALNAGDFREGARLLWEAARVNIAALAQSRGWPCDTRDDIIGVNTRRERRRWPCEPRDDIKQAIYKLDNGPYGKGRIYPNERFDHFVTVDILRQHAEEYDLLEDTEFEWILIWMRIASLPCVVSCGVVCRNSRACLSFYLDAIAWL